MSRPAAMSLTTSLRGPMRATTTNTTIPPSFLAPCLSRHTLRSGLASSWQRHAHTATSSASPSSSKQFIPSPTPFCPDTATFLQLIGRDMGRHAAAIGSWEALFGASSAQLKEMGVEPPRSRRYLLWWRDQFRRGRFGIGGDLAHVGPDGVAEVRVRVEPDGRRVAVNVPVGAPPASTSSEAVASGAADDDHHLVAQGVPVKGLQVAGPGKGRIVGSYFQPVQGTAASAARIKAAEGIWEVKRGRKIHGGERRRKNVLSRIAARARGTLK